MSISRPLYIPVILDGGAGAPASAQAARFVYQELRTRAGIRTDLLGLSEMDERPEADAVVFVTPGGEHAVPAALADRVRGLVAVSLEHRRGGRPVATSLAVLRELGQATMFWDASPGYDGEYDEAVTRSTEKFLGELARMAASPVRDTTHSRRRPQRSI